MRIVVYSRYTALTVRYSAVLTGMGFVLWFFVFYKSRRLPRRRLGAGEEEYFDEEELSGVGLEGRGEEDGYDLSLNWTLFLGLLSEGDKIEKQWYPEWHCKT